MANKKRKAVTKASAPVQPVAARQPVAEYILSVQDKKFTQTQIQQLMKIYESVCFTVHFLVIVANRPRFSFRLTRPSSCANSWMYSKW